MPERAGATVYSLSFPGGREPGRRRSTRRPFPSRTGRIEGGAGVPPNDAALAVPTADRLLAGGPAVGMRLAAIGTVVAAAVVVVAPLPESDPDHDSVWIAAWSSLGITVLGAVTFRGVRVPAGDRRRSPLARVRPRGGAVATLRVPAARVRSGCEAGGPPARTGGEAWRRPCRVRYPNRYSRANGYPSPPRRFDREWQPTRRDRRPGGTGG